VITIHQRHRQTDGQTDRQTTCDRNTALCTKVHRAVKTSCKARYGRELLFCNQAQPNSTHGMTNVDPTNPPLRHKVGLTTRVTLKKVMTHKPYRVLRNGTKLTKSKLQWYIMIFQNISQVRPRVRYTRCNGINLVKNTLNVFQKYEPNRTQPVDGPLSTFNSV